jgi:hypothetical protein
VEHIFIHRDPSGNPLTAISVQISGYQQNTSVNSFTKGTRPHKGRDYKVSDTHSFDQRDGSDWERVFRDHYDTMRSNFGDVSYPEVTETFDDLWEFYDFIGYDRKAKRFSDEVVPCLAGVNDLRM